MDYSPIKKILQDLLEEKQKMKVQAESDRIKKNDEDRAAIISTIGKDLTDSLKPVLEELAKNSKISSKELRDAIESTLNINIPPIKVPEANVNVSIPPIKVPTPVVNFDASKIKMPKIEMPSEMDIKGWVRLQGVDLDHPLPVQLRDAAGKPYNLLDGLTTMIAGGGGKADYLTIKGFSESAFSVPLNSDGEVKVAGTFTASAPATTYVIPGNRDGIIYNGDNPLPVVITSGAGGSTAAALIDSSGIQYSGSNPLPVVITSGASATSATNIVDSSGIAYSGSNPVPVTGSVAVSGLTGSIGATILNGEGIARDSWLVSDITNSLKAALVDSSGVQYSGSNPIPITGSVSVSATTGSIGATILNGEGIARDSWLVSDITTSLKSALIDSSGIQYSGSNPVPITGTITVGSSTGTTAGTILNGDGTYRDTFPVSGSVSVSGVTGSISVTQLNGDGTYKDTQPVSGTVTVSGITASTQATIIDSSGIGYSGSNPLPITWISGVGAGATTASVIVDSTGVAYEGANAFPVYWAKAAGTTQYVNIGDSTGIAYSGSNPLPITWVSGSGPGTTAAIIADSTGVQYSGSNPLPVILVSNVASSTVVVGPTADGGTDDGTNPLKTGGIARTTNPAAHSDGQTTSISLDSLGRQINRPVQMRGLIATAYVALATGTEATLLAAVAGKYNDLIYVLASNNSTVAVGIDLRAVTAGNILLHLEIPPNSTTGLSIPVPMFGAFADASGNNWTVDMPDITGTTVYVSALFSQEI